MSDTIDNPPVEFEIPKKLLFLFDPYRYKVAYGGRGGAKSWSFARALLVQAHSQKKLILCTREFQNSIADSVHRTLADQIDKLGLNHWFDVQKATITSLRTGSQFIFKGLRHNVQEIKSTEGVDIVWVAEAQSTSEDSWKTLIPTIRAPRSEIWVEFNPVNADDPTYKRFVLQSPPRACIQKVGWQDNAWLTPELDEERRYMLRVDPEAYDWVWEGHCQKISAAAIFRGKYEIESFDEPEKLDRVFYGADWGFANDPSVLIRCYIKDDCLYVSHEAYAVGVEIDDLPSLFAGGISGKTGTIYPGVPGARDWPIKADSARPETISYIRRKGFSIDAAKKWNGSVEDGIAHLKGFRKIIVHERCVHTAQEMRLYSYKTDRRTKDILPVIEDMHNHCIDSLRYALDGYIQRRGGLGVWARLLEN